MLSRNGHDLLLLSTKPDKIPDGNLNFLKLKVIEDFFPKRIKYPLRQIKSTFFPLDILALLSSYPIIRKINPDVLHLHNIHSFSLVIIAKLLRIPVVISIYDYGIVCPIGFLWKLRKFGDYEGTNCTKFHGTHCIDCIVKQKPYLKILTPLLIPLLGFRKKLLDRLLKKIDGFVVLSRSNAQVLENYGIEREKIGVVQIPSEQENYAQEIEIEENSILFIGWLHPRKGPHVVVRAMPHILREMPIARLYIFGDQKGNKEYKENILRFIKENNLEHSVFLFGRRPHSEVREYLRKANVLVIPETWETIATNTLTESLTFGKAIVASRMGGLKDYIIEGENGLLAENNNPIDFANKILSILKDKELRIKLGKNARISWEQLFSEKRVYDRLIDFYKMVCDSSTSR